MRFPFPDHVGLLRHFLDNRQAIVDSLERRLFGADGRASARNGDRDAIDDIFSSCFFESPAISPDRSRLKGQLDAAHLGDGFEPATQDGYSRELNPVELVLRGCHYWDGTRWPGRNGRLAFAQGLYTAFMIRQLEHLSLRIWDEGSAQAPERLQQIQHLVDTLNTGGGPSAYQLRLLRDARWLIQTAQGPLTRHLRPYFIKADHVSALPGDVRLEIHKAGAMLAGGHLRSQLRHLSYRTGWSFDDPQLLALTRSSNSMDMALLVRDLVPLLDAYNAACMREDRDARIALADAILQGMSADPELFLTRLDLLGPSTMIEDLFVDRPPNGAPPLWTPTGEAHRGYLAQYGELVAQTADALQQDSREFIPADAAYSPLGIVYGFCADLFANMVLNTLRSSSSSSRHLSVENVFGSRGELDEKLLQAKDWERLPKGDRERPPFEHSAAWAAQMGARLAAALEARAASSAAPNASAVPTARLYVVPRGVTITSLSGGRLPPGIASAQEHCLTSDVAHARDSGATLLTADRLIADRAEGRLLACVHADGAWFGVSKVPLTLFASQGKDASITDVPRAVIDVLRLVCPQMLVVIDE
jgi:hypothetical protein